MQINRVTAPKPKAAPNRYSTVRIKPDFSADADRPAFEPDKDQRRRADKCLSATTMPLPFSYAKEA